MIGGHRQGHGMKKSMNAFVLRAALLLFSAMLSGSCAAWPAFTAAAGLAAGTGGGGSLFFMPGGSSESVLSSIEITAPSTTFAKTTTQALRATALFSNGTHSDITADALWSSSDSSIVSVLPDGTATAVNTGSATITITYSGKTGQIVLTVSPAPLTSLNISCVNQASALPVGVTRACTATGNFADGSTQDLTSDPNTVWSTESSHIATISSTGVVTAQNTGTTTIRASHNGIQAAGVSLTVNAAALSSIEISPANASLPLGKKQQYTATGTYSDGSTQTITDQVTWSSADTNVATFSSTSGQEGLLSTHAEGSTTLTATLGAVSASTGLTVTEAVLESISITPASPSAAKGTTLQLTATGLLSDGTSSNITTQVTWSSDNTGIVTVANGAGFEGRATAVATGSTTITAEIGGIDASVTFTVTPAVLSSIQVNIDDSSIAKGTSTTATATGVYTDGSTQDIGDQVSWTSSVPSRVQIGTLTGTTIALISPKTGSTGNATITATLGAVNGTATLTVTAATLVSLQIDPTNPSVALGLTQAFTATGTYTDDTTQDLTTSVTWNSSNTSVATISNAAGQEGVATTLSQGTTQVGAQLGAVNAPTTTLTVGAKALQSITIAPNPTLSIAKGRTQNFTATGNYTDGSTSDLTETVTWVSSDTDSAAISNAAGSRGRLTALDEDTVDITATYNSITSDATQVTITAAVLDSIQVTPDDASLAKGLQQQYTATGVYSDATTLDLTDQVTWSASNARATVSNAGGSQGMVTAATTGSVSISATLGGVTGSTDLTVTAAVLVSIAVSPTEPSIYSGQTQNFTAVGTYSDASTQSITTQVTWTSSATAVATVSNAGGTEGRATGVAAGSTTITATHVGTGISGSTTLTILASDTTAPTVIGAASLSPTTVRITFSESVNETEATTASNYKVSLASAVSGSCSDNGNFATAPTTLSVSSVSGSGAVYTLTLGSSQTSGTSYTVLVDRDGIHDVGAPTPNALGCPNYADFVGQEQLKVSSAICASTTSFIVTFSKPVRTGNNVAGSAECTTATECGYRYLTTGGTSLGNITSAKILDGVVCGGATADASKVCLTHSLNQSGAQFGIVVANAVNGDGFDNAWGSIRDSGNTENVQTSPRDRVSFLGCGNSPMNFADGPISTNPFSDGSSFGYLTDYNGQIYIGPNSLGNAATRFAYNGSSPDPVSFSFTKDTTGGQSGNSASTRDGGIAVPPYVTLGHSGCSTNSGDLSTGCGPDNEDGRGVFATGALGGSPFLFLSGARSLENFDYIYYTSDSDTGLDFRYIDLGTITGTVTAGSQSMVVHNDRLYGGFAKFNSGSNAPDFGYVTFNSADSGTGYCTAGQNCDANDGTNGRRFMINRLPYFGGDTAGEGCVSGTCNWGYYVGVDSLYVFRNYVYAANGGLNKVNRNGSIIRSSVTEPTTKCTGTSDPYCADWTEIGPRSHASWYNSNTWWSLELKAISNLIPADRAFAMFAEYNGNLYVTRTVCQTAQSAATGIPGSFTAIAGCTDGTDTNRRAQLWKCVPETTGGADVCDAGDWSVVGDNGTGITNFGDANNRSITMVIKSGPYLYVAFDNTNGLEVWRTSEANPGSSSAVWTQIGGDGFGDPTNIRQFFSAVSVSVNGVDFLYVSAGRNGVPVRVYRQQN